VEGYDRRQLVVCGDQGTIDIEPLETFYCQPPQPQKLKLALSQARDSFKKGYQEDGLTIEEFEDFGPVQLFKSAFTKSWGRVLNIIKERRVQINPNPEGDPALIG